MYDIFMEPFKNIYQKKSITKTADAIAEIEPNFDRNSFITQSVKGLNKLELKERVDRIAETLDKTLPGSYSENTKTLIKTPNTAIFGAVDKKAVTIDGDP